MPIVFLSPSTQDWNPYVTGSGSEEYWMNRIVDAMEPYLRSNGIRYRRNDPDTSAGAAIREANSGYYDFYLALHSNAIGNGSAQTSARGIIAFYYPGSAGGQRGAELIAKICGRSTRCPTRSPPALPPHWERCPGPGSRRCWWRSATMTTIPTPSGWRAMWRMWPGSLSRP